MNTAGNILITCGGKWVGHVLQLRRAMADVPELAGGKVFVADRAAVTPAGEFADKSFVVPSVDDPRYIYALLQLCRRHQVRVLVSVVEFDVACLAHHKEAFAEIGTHAVVPPATVAGLCFDKRQFHQTALAAGLPVPRMWTAKDLDEAEFPVFAKPSRGYGSIGAQLCRYRTEAEVLAGRRKDLVFTSYLRGEELSIDALIGRNGRCLAAVQRVRDQVVGGEAYRSHTVFREEAEAISHQVIKLLAEHGHFGPVNIQVILGEESGVIDVNPRLGSAVLLSNMATRGRLFCTLLHEACGREMTGDPNDYLRDLSLYRFLGDVFYQGSQVVGVFPEAEVRPHTPQKPHAA